MAEKRENRKSRKNRNSETAVVTYFFLLLFVGMIAYFIYFQIIKSDEFINSPYNSLQDLFSERVVRGDILSADGKVLATSKTLSDGTEQRVYPYDNMFAHVVGYSVNGKAGIEKQENFNLLRTHDFFLKQIVNDVLGKKSDGDKVITTLDYDLQKAAYDSLGKYDGAVIAMDPSNGQILCMVSKPDYNPNTIASDWDEINSGESSVLVNRATQGKYAPGSVFKIFTLLEYYRENPKTYDEYSYNCKGKITMDDHTIHCASNKSHGQEDLQKSFAKSCNASFANIALTLNIRKYYNLCETLLFNQDLPIAFESSKSSFTLKKGDSNSLIMATGIGQGNTLVSPLHMMLISAAIENDGVLMHPYLVDRVESVGGSEISSNEPTEFGKLMSETEASLLQEYMRSVVTEGTGTKLSGQSYDAYGKTGTAQVSDTTDQTNAWFTGFAEKNGKSLAIAVVVEDSGAGSTYAVPIAKNVFDSYFE